MSSFGFRTCSTELVVRAFSEETNRQIKLGPDFTYKCSTSQTADGIGKPSTQRDTRTRSGSHIHPCRQPGNIARPFIVESRFGRGFCDPKSRSRTAKSSCSLERESQPATYLHEERQEALLDSFFPSWLEAADLLAVLSFDSLYSCTFGYHHRLDD